jgi:hypothetical protein
MPARTDHLLLLTGSDPDQAETRVRSFFEKNFLVRYDRIDILSPRTISAAHPEFHSRLEAGIGKNHRAIAAFLTELQSNGYQRLSDLAAMPRGYDSKVLHILTHLLDGFFGIDSGFYNLEEDSHTLSEPFRQRLRRDPAGFWLVEVQGVTESGNDANRLDLIRHL